MNVEMAVLDSPALIKVIVSTVCGRKATLYLNSGGLPGLPVPNSPCGLCGLKGTLSLNLNSQWGKQTAFLTASTSNPGPKHGRLGVH